MSDDLVKRLQTVSAMISLGERISWGQDTALMDEAAAEITRLSGRICVNCGQHAPASHDRRLPWPGCNAPDACTFDMTLDEAVNHHRQIAHARREEITRLQARLAAAEKLAEVVFYIDCEFDGHNGPLLSIAMVRGDGRSIHVTTGAAAADPWVIANVLPILGSHQADEAVLVRPHEVGGVLRQFIGGCKRPEIIADSPVDIARFCRAISTGENGGWASTGYSNMTFKVCNVDCYPTSLEGAVRHNAWWDAMALRAALSTFQEGGK
jgi:hypothetical protein